MLNNHLRRRPLHSIEIKNVVSGLLNNKKEKKDKARLISRSGKYIFQYFKRPGLSSIRDIIKTDHMASFC